MSAHETFSLEHKSSESNSNSKTDLISLVQDLEIIKQLNQQPKSDTATTISLPKCDWKEPLDPSGPKDFGANKCVPHGTPPFFPSGTVKDLERTATGDTLNKYFDKIDKGYRLIPWDTRDGAIEKSELVNFIDSPEGRKLSQLELTHLMRVVFDFDDIAPHDRGRLNPRGGLSEFAMLEHRLRTISKTDIKAYTEPQRISSGMGIPLSKVLEAASDFNKAKDRIDR